MSIQRGIKRTKFIYSLSAFSERYRLTQHSVTVTLTFQRVELSMRKNNTLSQHLFLRTKNNGQESDWSGQKTKGKIDDNSIAGKFI